jgi:hypothetical protein
MLPHFQTIVGSQFRAALGMLEECIRACPAEHWEGPIGKYAFWHVAYHALCFVDCYLTASNDEFQRIVAERAGTAFNPHPAGIAELEDEYPSRLFTREELLAYAGLCREKLGSVLLRETDANLDGSSGFSWLPFSRAELHLYNLRHVQHHAGQLSAALRRVGVDTRWIKSA